MHLDVQAKETPVMIGGVPGLAPTTDDQALRAGMADTRRADDELPIISARPIGQSALPVREHFPVVAMRVPLAALDSLDCRSEIHVSTPRDAAVDIAHRHVRDDRP